MDNISQRGYSEKKDLYLEREVYILSPAIVKGTPAFRRITMSFFFGGFVTFAIMYCTQPLLPLYTTEFHISPATASLALSVTTMALAIMMTLTASLSNAWGRKSIMVWALFGASALTMVSAWSPTFEVLLLCRVLVGIVLAGIPAIAMAYLGEEVAARDLGAAMGMYISGNAIGGMTGRIITGLVTDFFSWRAALLFIGLLGLVCAWWFWKNLPASRRFLVQPFSLHEHLYGLGRQFKDLRLLALYGIAFLLMGSFVTLYSYLGYQLMAPPYRFSEAVIGWVFTLYLVGSFSSSWLSRLADRWNRQSVFLLSALLVGLGALVSLSAALPVKILGVALVTFGFFGGHAIASGWVSKLAGRGRAQASALYLLFYYAGSSTGNTAGGFFWSADGWPGVIAMIGLFTLGTLLLGLLITLLEARATVRARQIPAEQISTTRTCQNRHI